MNEDLKYFEKIKRIEIKYPDKYSFICYNDVLDKIKIIINEKEINKSSLILKSRYLKQIKFETVVFLWLEKEGYIKNFSESCEDAIIPSDEYCKKRNIHFSRSYITGDE